MDLKARSVIFSGFAIRFLISWQKLWSRQRRKKLTHASVDKGDPGAKKIILKSGPLRVHFQHSGAKIRMFEQNTDIAKFWPLKRGGGGG